MSSQRSDPVRPFLATTYGELEAAFAQAQGTAKKERALQSLAAIDSVFRLLEDLDTAAAAAPGP